MIQISSYEDPIYSHTGTTFVEYLSSRGIFKMNMFATNGKLTIHVLCLACPALEIRMS